MFWSIVICIFAVVLGFMWWLDRRHRGSVRNPETGPRKDEPERKFFNR